MRQVTLGVGREINAYKTRGLRYNIRGIYLDPPFVGRKSALI